MMHKSKKMWLFWKSDPLTNKISQSFTVGTQVTPPLINLFLCLMFNCYDPKLISIHLFFILMSLMPITFKIIQETRFMT